MAFSFFRKWRERRNASSSRGTQEPDDLDMSWFYPPADVHDSARWDRYWHDQAAHGLTPPLFDMFSFGVADLIRCLLERGVKTVLCAGNGMSQEPRALAAVGFQVTVLDLSPAAVHFAEAWQCSPEEIDRFCTPDQRAPGGSVKFVIGDIMNAVVCPGPFDAIIERRTLQLFPEAERGDALDRLAARLQPDGLFLSHCHDGRWKPPGAPVHQVERFFHDRGWTIWRQRPPESPNPTGRIARLQMSTG